MIAGPGFSVPHEIDEILERLPQQLTHFIVFIG